ncbi:MAG: hypothetical protein R3C97_17175 [Geminicoccaceae bacterium]
MPKGETLAAVQLPQVRPLVELFQRTCRGDGHELARLLFPLAHEWFDYMCKRLQRLATDGDDSRRAWLERARAKAERTQTPAFFSLLRSVIVRIGKPVQARRTTTPQATPNEADDDGKTRLERQRIEAEKRHARRQSPHHQERLQRARGRGLLVRELTTFLANRLVELAWHELRRQCDAEKARKAAQDPSAEAHSQPIRPTTANHKKPAPHPRPHVRHPTDNALNTPATGPDPASTRDASCVPRAIPVGKSANHTFLATSRA